MLVAGLCTAHFKLILDVVVIYVALPTISRDLRIADSTMHLVEVAYTVAFGSRLIPSAVPVTSSADVGCW